MPKQILIIALLFVVSTSSTYCQKGFGLKFGASSGWRVLTVAKSSLYRSERFKEESVLLRPEVQIFYNYFEKNGFKLSAGIGYAELGYQINRSLIDPGFSLVTTGFEKELFRYRARYLRVPLNFSKSVGKKKRLDIQGGISILYLLNSEFQYLVRRNMFETNVINEEEWKVGENFQLAFDTGICYHLNPNQKHGLEICLETSLLFNGFENAHISESVYNIGRFVGVDKTTKEHLLRISVLVKYVL